MPRYTMTLDGWHFVVKGRLWRCTYPSPPSERQQQLVAELMAARHGVKSAVVVQDAEALRQARREVNRVKVELGEPVRSGGTTALRIFIGV